MSARILTLRQRLTLIGMALLLTPLSILAVVSIQQLRAFSSKAHQTAEARAGSDLDHAAEAALASIQSDHADVLQPLRTAHATLNAFGGFQIIRYRRHTWNAVNQETGVNEKITLPELIIGSVYPYRRRFTKPFSDQVSGLTGAACSVYERMNAAGDMLLVPGASPRHGASATYLPGRSAHGTANPAITAVLAGNTYQTETSAFEPLKVPGGFVLGMIGLEMPAGASVARVRDRLSNMPAAHSGEIFALSSAGDYVFTTRSGSGLITDAGLRRTLAQKAISAAPNPVRTRYAASSGSPMILNLRYLDAKKYVLAIAVPDPAAKGPLRVDYATIAAVSAGLALVSLLLWFWLSSRTSAHVAAFVRQSREDGGRLIAWSKRMLTAPKTSPERFTASLSAIGQAQASIHEGLTRTGARAEQTLALTGGTAKQLEETRQQLGAVQSSLDQLSSANLKISGLMRTVDEIAFQSKILALNARIEAARAGESGVSFAVVADQFGALAERCAGTAASTTEFLTESTLCTRSGSDHLRELSKSLEAIASCTANLRGAVEDISSGSPEQLRTSAEFGRALVDLRELVTRQDAAPDAARTQELQVLTRQFYARITELAALLGAKPKHESGPRLVETPKKLGRAAKSRAKAPSAQRAVVKSPANNRSARRAC